MATSDGGGRPTRRSVVRFLGGVGGVALFPTNFVGCSEFAPVVRGSRHRPTPEEPITPVGDFYVNTNFFTPTVPSGWRLTLDGLVDEPRSLSFADLDALPQVSTTLTLECIGNSPGGNLISSGTFTGPLLRDVLREAGLSPRSRGLVFSGLDGYPSYLPVSVLDEGGMLALYHGGEPLRIDHGAPCRALIPGRYGMFSVKWLDAITATRDFATYGSLGQLANFLESRTELRSRIDRVISDGSEVRVGEPVTISGLAVSPGDGISKVQVDDGTGWRDATIDYNPVGVEPDNPLLWSLWSLTWTPERPGEQVLAVRAIDGTGTVQLDDVGFPYDGGAVHRRRVVVAG